MSSLHFHSKSRKRTGKKSRSNSASIGLCLAAAVITVSAAAVKAQKDRTAFTPPAEGVSSSQTVDSTGQTEPAVSDAASGQTEQTAGQAEANTGGSSPDGASQQVSARPEVGDEMEDTEDTLAIQVLGKDMTRVRPVGGAVAKPYSMNSLTYCKTMGDWRVHRGVDLSANLGEVVKSVAEGKVVGVSNDPLYGTTVVVNQNDGLMVYYRGLSKDAAVREGENISAGTTVGTVGEIPCESGDGVHLHIEVMREGNYLDPCEALGIQ